MTEPKINDMKINKLAINKAKSFDETINGMVKIFEGGSAIANITKLSKLGKEYKVASLLKELSINGEVSEETFNRVVDSTFGESNVVPMRRAMKLQFIEVGEPTFKTVKEMIENKSLAKLSEGRAFIKYLERTYFVNTDVQIDVDAEYEIFLTENPQHR